MRCWVGTALLLGSALVAVPRTAGGQRAVERASPQAFISNTVRIQAGSASGFGFLVGLLDGQLLFATARHTVSTAEGLQVCFPPRGRQCAPAAVAYVADAVGREPPLDLVLLTAPAPPHLLWRPDAMGEAAIDESVWVIGRGVEWWIPPEPGRVVRLEPEQRLIRYRGLPVAPGVSGGPIIGPDGIVAMHLEEVGDSDLAAGLEIGAIRERVTQRTRGTWILLPTANCNAAPALEGRSVSVQIDAARPRVGLEAMARIRCSGGRPVPAIVQEGETWQGAIVYRSGGLRDARILQRLLLPLARLETRLGEPEQDLDVWIR